MRKNSKKLRRMLTKPYCDPGYTKAGRTDADRFNEWYIEAMDSMLRPLSLPEHVEEEILRLSWIQISDMSG